MLEIDQVYQNTYFDRYKVVEVYGGTATPLPKTAHLELIERGIEVKGRRPQEFVTLTEKQVKKHLAEVRP